MVCANQTTGSTNGRAANWALEVVFSPFCVLSVVTDVPVRLLNQPTYFNTHLDVTSHHFICLMLLFQGQVTSLLEFYLYSASLATLLQHCKEKLPTIDSTPTIGH